MPRTSTARNFADDDESVKVVVGVKVVVDVGSQN
jgi:hypothetical protein